MVEVIGIASEKVIMVLGSLFIGIFSIVLKKQDDRITTLENNALQKEKDCSLKHTNVATKDDIRELRSEMQNGFENITNHLMTLAGK